MILSDRDPTNSGQMEEFLVTELPLHVEKKLGAGQNHTDLSKLRSVARKAEQTRSVPPAAEFGVLAIDVINDWDVNRHRNKMYPALCQKTQEAIEELMRKREELIIAP